MLYKQLGNVGMGFADVNILPNFHHRFWKRNIAFRYRQILVDIMLVPKNVMIALNFVDRLFISLII